MTMENALRFIKRGLGDNNLRKRLNTTSNVSEIQLILADEQLAFSPQDFDQAFHSRLLNCQELEDAEQLKEFKMWWDLLFLHLNTDVSVVVYDKEGVNR